MMNLTEERLTFTVPLSFEAHAIAEHCCYYQPNAEKAKQVYLKTLAVYAVDFYLRCMGFETDWETSDSRNPLMLKFMDVADLDIKNLGKLECRPVLEGAEIIKFPPDVWEDRIGYVAVELNQSLKQAIVLGFMQAPAAEVHRSQLQTLEEFPAYLARIRRSAPVNLGQWFQGIIEAGWQTMEELLSLEQMDLALEYRAALEIARGRQINLGMQLAGTSVALIVALVSEADAEVDLRMQLYPMEGETYLPPELKLIVIDNSGEEVLSTESREVDNFIQLEFTAELGETFSVAVVLGDARVTQEFVV